MVILLLAALAGALLGGFGSYLAVSGRRKRLRRVAIHMKPGYGPTVEGLLVAKTHREFHLIKAEMLIGPDDTTELANPLRVLRENVFGFEVLE